MAAQQWLVVIETDDYTEACGKLTAADITDAILHNMGDGDAGRQLPPLRVTRVLDAHNVTSDTVAEMGADHETA